MILLFGEVIFFMQMTVLLQKARVKDEEEVEVVRFVVKEGRRIAQEFDFKMLPFLKSERGPEIIQLFVDSFTLPIHFSSPASFVSFTQF